MTTFTKRLFLQQALQAPLLQEHLHKQGSALPSPEENTHYAECFLVQIIVLVFSNGDGFTPCCNVDGTLRSLCFTSRFGFTTFWLYKDKSHTSHDEPDCRIPSDPTNNLHTIATGSC